MLFASLKNNKVIKKSRSLEYLCCEEEFLKNHIEAQFRENIDWKIDNWSSYDNVNPYTG